jgi:hypothetical protein
MRGGRRFQAAVLAACTLVAISLAAVPAAPAAPPAPPPKPPTATQSEQAIGLACYWPQQIERAYHLGPLYARGFNGKGTTIVIVDPFGSPTIGNDLHVFDTRVGLPDPPFFRVLQPVGPVPPYDPKDHEMVAKASETTLDLAWSHAIAPGANILLVETPGGRDGDRRWLSPTDDGRGLRDQTPAGRRDQPAASASPSRTSEAGA